MVKVLLHAEFVGMVDLVEAVARAVTGIHGDPPEDQSERDFNRLSLKLAGAQINCRDRVLYAYSTGALSGRNPLSKERVRGALMDAESVVFYIDDLNACEALCEGMLSFELPVEDTPAHDDNGASLSDASPLSTLEIAMCFAGARGWDEAAWKGYLGDPPKWLSSCMVTRGQQGVRPSTWNPVLIAAALVHKNFMRATSARALFQKRANAHHLGPWLDQWKTYEADNLEDP